MECLSYEGEYGIRKCMHIEMFKEELAWVIDKWLRAVSNLFKTVVPL